MNPAKGSRRNFLKGAALASSTGLAGSCATSAGGGRHSTTAKARDARENLISFMQGLDTIDCHEHLQIEPDRLNREVDVLTLFSLYEYVDATSAGYEPRPGENLFVNNLFLDTSVPLKERWENAWPHLQDVQYGSYCRAPRIALRDLYGIAELNDSTYAEASEKIRAANKPGLYKSVLRDKCGIKTCLVQNGKIEGQVPYDLLTPVFVSMGWYQLTDPKFVTHIADKKKVPITNLDEYLNVFGQELTEVRQKGAVACKIAAAPYVEPNMEGARKSFDAVLQGNPADPVLQATLLDFLLQKAAEWDWPICVHTGVWGDFRTLDPKHVIGLVMKHPKVRFDIYHLGMPFVRDCIFIAKSFPNAYLDLCWCYVLSEEITRQSINEIIDTVPVNKIHGFGADYIWAVENVYGHLLMARETLAEALSERMARSRIDKAGAEHILRLWLHDNPVRFYKLPTA